MSPSPSGRRWPEGPDEGRFLCRFLPSPAASRPPLPEGEGISCYTSHAMSFVTTRWSLVVKASSHDTSQARDALARLCQTYWYPLYTFVRRRGHPPEDAQDL